MDEKPNILKCSRSIPASTEREREREREREIFISFRLIGLVVTCPIMNSIQCQPVDVDGKQENKDRTRTANIRKFLWGFFISLIKIFFFFFSFRQMSFIRIIVQLLFKLLTIWTENY
jgi:hypothetical protein